MCPQADAVTLRECGRQGGESGRDCGAEGAVIISGKRDFKYFMQLKLAAKKESRKIMQERGTWWEAARLTRCGCHGCQQGMRPRWRWRSPPARPGQEDSDQAGCWQGWQAQGGGAGLAGNLSHFDFCSSVITS